ncbi:bacteriophage abortive infection AbiH family protein [Flavobacterium sp. N3904]|uniref:bacteriophage abortive infection AbiH family protein n=1 Tax=Flavobacterium sp. N3904 TaxID=2986835 RepID=UPI002224CFA1|nr:bacteriophage abortive infection AbiH family protein [Flavobacterium sp. N3904]
MAKILITGNGFDLFHHLPTKYGHFMSIMRTIEKNDYTNEVSFEELFGDIFKNKFAYDFNSIVENYKVEDIKFDFNKINELKELLKENLWYKYFTNVIEIETWIDFEGEVENVLKQISILLKSETPQFKKVNNYRDVLINYSDFNLFGIIEHKYDDKDVFSIAEKYVDKRRLGIKSSYILNDLSNSFESFIIIFNQYLADVVVVFYENKINNATIPFHLINKIYTFNYTPSLEKIYKIDKTKLVYLHGELNEDSNIQNLVLGISEISKEIKDSKMYNFTKYYQKVRKNSNKKFIDIPKEKSVSLDETIFYIIGHSLDESDREYILDLFKFLELDHNNYSKICVFYYNENDKENKLRNLFSIIDKDIIVNMNNTGRLYFVELNVENLNYEFSKQTEKATSPSSIF